MQTITVPKFVPIKQMAEKHGVSVHTVRRWVGKGLLHSRVATGDGYHVYIEVAETGKPLQLVVPKEKWPTQIMRGGYTFIPLADWNEKYDVSGTTWWCAARMVRYVTVDIGAQKKLYYIDADCKPPKTKFASAKDRRAYREKRRQEIGESFRGCVELVGK